MPADFSRVVYFLVVCEQGSIAKAAESLYITPQALNRQIRNLEDDLGEKLFHRSTRGMRITEFGHFYRNQMLPVYRLYIGAQKQVKDYLNKNKTNLRLDFFQGIPKRRVIQPVITELVVALPDTQIELGSAEMDDVYSDLSSGKADLAISYVNPVDDIGFLEEIPLLTLSGSVVVSRQHPWALTKQKISLEDMASEPVLYLNRKKGPDRQGFYSELRASSYHYANSYNAMLVQLGLGKHYGVFPTVFEDLEEMGLQAFPLPQECQCKYNLSLLYRRDNPYAELFAGLKSLQNVFWQMLSVENYQKCGAWLASGGAKDEER